MDDGLVRLWLSARGASTCILVWVVSVLVRKRVDGVGVFYIFWSSGRCFSFLFFFSFPSYCFFWLLFLCLFFFPLIPVSHACICSKPFLYYLYFLLLSPFRFFFFELGLILGPNGAYSFCRFPISCLLFPRFRFYFPSLFVQPLFRSLLACVKRKYLVFTCFDSIFSPFLLLSDILFFSFC